MTSRPVGVKIRHRTARNCVVLVPLPWIKMQVVPSYGVNGRCPVCDVVHHFKTFHLNVVDDGTCLVSEGVFDNLCKAGAIDGVPESARYWRNKGGRRKIAPLAPAPFEFVDRVEPPPLNMGIGNAPVTDAEGRPIRFRGTEVYRLHEDFS